MLIGFSAVTGLWWVKAMLFGSGSVDRVLAGVTIPLAIGAAVYTAFLFGQAEGRDLWQSKLLAPHLLVQAVFAGSAAWLVLEPAMGTMALHTTMATVFTGALVMDLVIGILDILVSPHGTDTAEAAVRSIRRGRYKLHFWVGGLLLGHVIPLVLVWNGGASAAVAGLAALIGLYLYEHAYVYAPQDVPNS